MIISRIVSIPMILEDGQIQLREDTIYEEEGIELFRKHHRRVLSPGDIVTSETRRIQDICGVIWTQEVIDEFKRKQAVLNEDK